MKKTNSESQKLDRKTVEKNRRIHMKGLCFKLASLIPSHHFKHSKDMLSQQGQLDHAAAYINHLKERTEKLRKKKELITMRSSGSINAGNYNNNSNNKNNAKDGMKMGLKLPIVELRELGSTIEVILISGLNKNFMLYEVISIIEEEGAEVVTASFSTVGVLIFHSIHAQVKISRVGVETSRVWQRLQELIK